MDRKQLINSIIVDLDHLTVQGAGNMNIVVTSIRRLTALREDLRKGEEAEVKTEWDADEETPTEKEG